MASKPFKLEETVAKKLALWHTPTFRPIMTHKELEPLMVAFGFVALPLARPPQLPEGQQQQSAVVVWQEYASLSEAALHGGRGWKRRRRASGAPPRPRLPHPRIDGLHLMTYKAFLMALEFYLGPNSVPDLFHVRTMSLSRRLDRVFGKCYRPMKDCEMEDERILVFREGTLDHITRITVSQYNDDEIDDNNNGGGCGGRANSMKETNPNDSMKNTYLVPLKDLFPTDNIATS